MIELHHWEPNAESLKLIIALKEKGVDFTSRYVDLLALEHHGEAFRAASDGGRVPLVVADGHKLKDSQLALEYLAEAYEPRLAPADPAGWYDVQAWTAQLDQALSVSVRLLGWHTSTLPALSEAEREDFLARSAGLPRPVVAGWAQVTSDAEASEDQLALARDRIAGGVDKIEAALEGGDWILGDYSVVDINAFALVHTLPRLTPDLVNADRTPRTMAWLERMGARAAVRDALAMRRSDRAPDLYAPGV